VRSDNQDVKPNLRLLLARPVHEKPFLRWFMYAHVPRLTAMAKAEILVKNPRQRDRT
jgi:hypothetical protein